MYGVLLEDQLIWHLSIIILSSALSWTNELQRSRNVEKKRANQNTIET